MQIITGNDLVQMTIHRLGGYSNYPDADVLLEYLNEAKDEVWGLLKQTMNDYFDQQSQPADASLDNYFPPLQMNVRVYDLPPDFREMRWISCETPGYEDRTFVLKKLTDAEFREAYKDGTMSLNNGGSGPNPISTYIYAVTGKGELVLASPPEYPLEITLWYTRWVQDFAAAETIDEVLLPYSKKMADYAAKKVMLMAQDQNQFALWKENWLADVTSITNNSSPRNEADAVFVEDFEG